MRTPLLDGIQKEARVTKSHVRRNTPITSNLDEFLAKLRPGDILLSKPKKTSKNIFARISRAIGKQHPWSHGGIYAGDGKINHIYFSAKTKDISGEEQKTTSKGREQNIDTLRDRLGRDFLAMRPKGVTELESREALERSKKMIGRKFSVMDYLRAGLLPSKNEGKMKDGMPVSAMCTGMVASAYPNLKIKADRSKRHTRPSDFFESRKMQPLIALSTE